MDGFPQRLEADDFCLRPMERGDLPEVSRQLGVLDTAQWLAAVAHPFTPPDAETLFRHAMDPPQRVRIIDCGGSIAGCLGLGASVWYWLGAAYRGRGLMQRVLRAAVAQHFSVPAPPLVATCRTDNTASAALLVALGFARTPRMRKMFFQATGCAQVCHDYVMTAGQWHLINPPCLSVGGLTLRPMRQQDAPTLARMLSTTGVSDRTVWPAQEDIPAFIETHRCRAPGSGLFAVEDELGRLLALTLWGGVAQAFSILCPEPGDRARCTEAISRGLAATER